MAACHPKLKTHPGAELFFSRFADVAPTSFFNTSAASSKRSGGLTGINLNRGLRRAEFAGQFLLAVKPRLSTTA